MKTNRDMKFNNIIKTMIVEQGRYEILKKTYTQPKKKGETVKPAKMSLEQLNKIVLSDPTTRRDGDTIKKAGKYVNCNFAGLITYGVYKRRLQKSKKCF